jgi:hypothetical protein
VIENRSPQARHRWIVVSSAVSPFTEAVSNSRSVDPQRGHGPVTERVVKAIPCPQVVEDATTSRCDGGTLERVLTREGDKLNDGNLCNAPALSYHPNTQTPAQPNTQTSAPQTRGRIPESSSGNPLFGCSAEGRDMGHTTLCALALCRSSRQACVVASDLLNPRTRAGEAGPEPTRLEKRRWRQADEHTQDYAEEGS